MTDKSDGFALFCLLITGFKMDNRVVTTQHQERDLVQRRFFFLCTSRGYFVAEFADGLS